MDNYESLEDLIVDNPERPPIDISNLRQLVSSVVDACLEEIGYDFFTVANDDTMRAMVEIVESECEEMNVTVSHVTIIELVYTYAMLCIRSPFRHDQCGVDAPVSDDAQVI